MTFRFAAAAVLLDAAFAVQPVAAATIRGGEWETSNDGGPKHLTCEKTDHTYNQASLDKMMQMSGAKCTPGDFHDGGTVVTYKVVCEIAGGKMTSNSVITMIGIDSYTTHSTTHMEGGSMKMPDIDMTQVAHRLGGCKPGDSPSIF
jgi:roadblock/LC7 domain-containing protein